MNRLTYSTTSISIIIIIISFLFSNLNFLDKDGSYLEDNSLSTNYSFSNSDGLNHDISNSIINSDTYEFLNELFNDEKSASCESGFLGPLMNNEGCGGTCSGCIGNGSAGQPGQPSCYTWTCNDGFCAPVGSACCASPIPAVS